MEGAGRGGWDPENDGGVDPALLRFLRVFFRPSRATRKLAITIASASASLSARVPQRIMAHIRDISADNEADEADEDSSSEELDDERALREELPLRDDDVEEPALRDRGGEGGEILRLAALMRLRSFVPTTADATEKVVDLARAVVCYPVVIWTPCGDWTTVNELIQVLCESFHRSSAASSPLAPRSSVSSSAARGRRLPVTLRGAAVGAPPCRAGPTPGSRRHISAAPQVRAGPRQDVHWWHFCDGGGACVGRRDG